MNNFRYVIHRLKWLIKNIKRFDPALYDKYANEAFVKIPATSSHGEHINYNSDGLIVLNNCDCLNESRFQQAYQSSLEVNDWRGPNGVWMDMRWRYYIVCWVAEHTSRLEGDFVECGVYKGGYAKAIINYLNFDSLNKKFYLLDTFKGLVPDYASDEEKASGLLDTYDHYQDVFEDVKQTFQGKDFIQLIRGPVPDTLPQCQSDKICYLSIDMNMVSPEIAAANYFWDKIVSGGIMILDDYGFYAHQEQKRAFDNFAKEKQVSILSLPTGQALIFKP